MLENKTDGVHAEPFALLCPTDKRPCTPMCAAYQPADADPRDAAAVMAARLDPSARGRCTRFDALLARAQG